MPTSMNDFDPPIDFPEVEGLLSEKEGKYLYSLVRRLADTGAIVEIGSWKGRSTVFLAKGCQSVGTGNVFAIDPHTPDGSIEQAFRDNINRTGVDAFVTPLVMSSIEAVQSWDKRVGLLWMDGDHKYGGVRADFFAWYPHVAVGGAIAFHDTLNRRGVARFVLRHIRRLERLGLIKVLDQVDEILAVQKIAEFSSFDRWNRTWFVKKEYLRRHFALSRAATSMGRQLLRAGDPEKARECFKLALSYYPMHGKNLFRLLVTYVPWLHRRYTAKWKKILRQNKAS